MKIWIVLASLALATAAYGHDHWINEKRFVDPISKEWCCNHIDCRNETANIEEEAGGVRVKETNELIPHNRVIWESPDGWWRCRNLATNETRCLIGPPNGS